MAKVNLCGVQPLDFTTREGKALQGIKLHVSFQDENVMGYAVDTKFISSMACKNLHITLDDLEPLIGQVVEFETNLNGKITGIHAISDIPSNFSESVNSSVVSDPVDYPSTDFDSSLS